MKVILAILCLAGTCLARDYRPVVWGGVNVGLAALDYETALRVQGPAKPCYESDPLWGTPYPSRARFYSRGLPFDFALEGFGYFLFRHIKRTDRTHKVWEIPFLAVSTYHLAGTYSNLNCGRSLR